MKTIITIALCLLYVTSSLAAGGVRINGDVTLEQGADRVLYFSNGSSQQFASPWSFLGSSIFYNVVGGNVGIGTATPTYKLDVEHTGSTGLRVKSSSSFSVIDIDSVGGDSALRFQKAGVNHWNIRNNPTDDSLQVFELGGGGERLRISKTTGYVGIGTPAPTTPLDVTGTVKATAFQGDGSALTNMNYPRIATSQASGIKTIGAACTNYLSVTITVPGAGFVDVGASNMINLSHTLNTEDRSMIFIGSSISDCSYYAGGSGYSILAGVPSSLGFFTSSPRRVFPVAAGTYTYYLNGYMEAGQDELDRFWQGSMVATWYPN